jgi:hypothetical protein
MCVVANFITFKLRKCELESTTCVPNLIFIWNRIVTTIVKIFVNLPLEIL